ncbi:uncharacterized protein LOC116347982, partial [Contarinia nasturtii]|uniref:uncharacterized protein LOC116347982 n=1 Tax=Contarinia nasturtii TaxID=265458 RepID=UPI0012D38A48
MSTKLNRLLSIRTRVIEDLEHHAEEVMKFTETSNATLISYRIRALEKAYHDFASTIDTLEEMPQYHTLENLTDIKTKNRQIQDLYLNSKFHVSEFVENEEDRNLNASFFQTTRTTSNTTLNTSETITKNMGIRLEKISVPHFNGKYEKWPEFKAMFTSLMNKYQGDNIEKLTHLKNYLEGEAKDIIKHLNDYNAAWDLLVSQYENKHAIVSAHLKNFHDIPVMSTAASIRFAITTTNSCLAGIKNLDILTDTWDPMIVFTLQEKLSPELRHKWEEERKGSHEPTTLKQFLEFLETRYKISSVLPPRRIHIRPNHNDSSSLPTAEKSKRDTSMEEEEEKQYGADEYDAAYFHTRSDKCRICSAEHSIFSCPMFQNSEIALRVAKEKKLCLNCLYDNHETEQCTSQFDCQRCKKRHHTLLHDALSTMDPASRPEKTFHNRAETKGPLLATALVPIHTKRGVITLRALIDQGSTTNLLSERGAKLLQCSRQRITPFPMFGLANVTAGTATHKTSLLIGSVHDKNYRLPLPTFITQDITKIKPIHPKTFAQWPHLKGLQLADSSTSNSHQIDLLIGSRTFAEIVDYGLIKGKENQPIAQNTKLGWIISGGYEENDKSIRINMINN